MIIGTKGNIIVCVDYKAIEIDGKVIGTTLANAKDIQSSETNEEITQFINDRLNSIIDNKDTSLLKNLEVHNTIMLNEIALLLHNEGYTVK